VSSVVDHHLQDGHTQKSALAYFYCDRNRPDTRSAESVLNCITRQLATPTVGGPILFPAVKMHREHKKKAFASGSPTFEQSSSILVDILRCYQSSIIIIDALDECDQTRGKLISTLCQIINQATKVKIFISSRRDADITNQLRLIPNISVEATNNREDITSFVTQNIQPLPIGQELRDEICHTLVERSEGV
jgi:hypothetical protein